MDRRRFLASTAVFGLTPVLPAVNALFESPLLEQPKAGTQRVTCSQLAKWDMWIAKDVGRLALKDKCEGLVNRVRSLRKRLAANSRIKLPIIHIRDTSALSDGSVMFAIAEHAVQEILVEPHSSLAVKTERVTERLEDQEGVHWLDETGRFAWVTSTPALTALEKNYELLHPFDLCMMILAKLAHTYHNATLYVPKDQVAEWLRIGS